jgi:excisionase family DNA binding protein
MTHTSTVTTTIRVDERVRDQLARRATANGRSIGAELAAILENLRWQEFKEDTAALRADPELYAGYVAETKEWLDADLGSGLAQTAAAKYSEYQRGTGSDLASVECARAKRLAFMEWLAAGGLPDFSDNAVMDHAWQSKVPPATADVTPSQAELTTQQAADLLNVSRPYLIGLLESGEIPYRMAGGRRWIAVEALIAYKRHDDLERRSAADALADISQELELH